MSAVIHPLRLGSRVRYSGEVLRIVARSYCHRDSCAVHYDLALPGGRTLIDIPGDRLEPVPVIEFGEPVKVPADWINGHFLKRFRGWADVPAEDGDILPAPVRA